jgi:O-antigen ligase
LDKSTLNKSHRINELVIPFAFLVVASFLGVLWGTMEANEPVRIVFTVCMGSLIGIMVLAYPLVGVALTITSTAIVELLPSIPALTSVIPLLGLLTIAAYIIQELPEDYRKKRLKLTSIEFLCLVWILWVFLSNPESSLSGLASSWISTFVQLWILGWLARRVIQSEDNHRLVMVILVTGILVSAFSVIQQTRLGIFDLTDRATGLSGGANTAARYFAYGIILLVFLQSQKTVNSFWRLIAFIGIGILMVAIFYTGSRSGVIVLGVALILLAKRFLIGRRGSWMLLLIFVAGIVWFWVQAAGTVMDPKGFLNSILNGTDTVGYRYNLWKAGWLMWIDHPLTGVGIGNYGVYLLKYWSASYLPKVFTPHNTYVQVLAETGIIGIILFTAIIVLALKNFWQRARFGEAQFADANWIWFVVLIVLLLGGISKTDIVDKLLWFMIGVSSSDSWI